MNEELNEVMENEIDNNEMEVIDLEPEDYAEEGGSGKFIALTVGVVTGLAALGVAAYKKLKDRKADKPKKKRKKLMWVEVEDDDDSVVDVEATEIDEDDEETDEK